jgi:hypothetical protein
MSGAALPLTYCDFIKCTGTTSPGPDVNGPGWLSRYSNSLPAGLSGDRMSVGGEIFCTSPDRPWGQPSLLYNGYRVSFPGVKRPGRGVDHPLASSARVKGRVELYLYSPSGPSWPVVGRTLP